MLWWPASQRRLSPHTPEVCRYESELTKLRSVIAGGSREWGARASHGVAPVSPPTGANTSPDGGDSVAGSSVKLTQRGAGVHSSKGRQVADLSLKVMQLREGRDAAMALLEAERRFSSALAHELCQLAELPTSTGAGSLSGPQRDLGTRRDAAQSLVKTVRAALTASRRERDAAVVRAETAQKAADEAAHLLQMERNAVYVLVRVVAGQMNAH